MRFVKAAIAARFRASMFLTKKRMSAPAMNALPLPAITMPRTAGSAAAAPERRRELLDDRLVQRVQGVGPVDRQRGHAVRHLARARSVNRNGSRRALASMRGTGTCQRRATSPTRPAARPIP